jgi:transposase-like protein
VGRKRVITPELEVMAIRLFAERGATDVSVARDLGIDRSTLGRWRRRQLEVADPEVLRTRAEHAELVELRRRVKVLEEEREILAKAAAFLDRETGRRRSRRSASSTERRPTTP